MKINRIKRLVSQHSEVPLARRGPVSGNGVWAFLSVIMFLMKSAAGTAGEAPPGEVILAQPQRIYLGDGRVYEGHAIRLMETALVFREVTEEGEVEYTFASGDIRKLEFPGETIQEEALMLLESGEPTAAIPLMNALYRQRQRFLALMEVEQVVWFLHYVEALLEAADYYSAIAVALQLEPFVVEESKAIRLQERLLLAHHLIGLEDRLQTLAESLRQRTGPYRQSALSSYLPAQWAAEAEDWETVLNLLLEPIVYSSQFPMEHLPEVYALAIRACEEMGDQQHADLLREEKQHRYLNQSK